MQDFLISLFEHVSQGKQLEFRYLVSFKDYLKMLWIKYAILSTLGSLKKLARHLLRSYCRDIEQSRNNPNKLLIYSALLKAINFYETDLNTVKNILYSYWSF